MANYLTIDQEEVTRLGLASTLVGEDDLAIARETHQVKVAKDAAAAAVADAVIFEDGPQPAQDGQEQGPGAEEASEATSAAEGAKAGRRR